METCAVMVVPCPERAEEILLAGDMPCPRCRGVLRPFGTGRTRTVRGVGADTVTVTPRRARCADCQVTQILLPTELLVRRADSTEAIGNALVAKAGGAGFRSIAARFGRPESTVRRWLRAVREPHAQWLYQRGVDSAVLVDVELLDRPAPQRTTLGHGLNLLAGAAVRLRDSFDISDPVWSLIGFFAHGRCRCGWLSGADGRQVLQPGEDDGQQPGVGWGLQGRCPVGAGDAGRDVEQFPAPPGDGR